MIANTEIVIVNNHDITNPAIAIPFFCFLTKAIIPKMIAKIHKGIPNISQITVRDKTTQTIANTKLVTENQDLFSTTFTVVFFVGAVFFADL